ncbi:STAS domain-containing protein [Plastoroseomonas arctica]|uniref:STAS domain-containing protein n=1 Tax=Plastoroseomonas arctica TaxID=1509237 RepID=A0AAF1K0U8_9PROT|nr:STAS domain-containing protein [Plastoroseomonas arctica]MBR0654831.1 STAS domain-containing protein [Plastoroseomonas arctica]
MEFEVHDIAPDLAQVVLSGRLDAVGAEVLDLPFTAQIGHIGKNVIVDLSAVPFVGSLGIRVLISGARVLQRSGHRMAIYGVVPAVAEVFDIVALEDLIPLAPDMAAARGIVGG